jgi:hypothetical protein
MIRKSKFRIADRIRVIAIPQSVLDMPPKMRNGVGGTLTVFRWLLKTKRPHKVIELDPDNGWPWIKFQFREKDGRIHHHKLMIEPECVELVRE